jgi:hypothetical protein
LTPLAFRSSSIVMRSRTLRPSRSSFHTMSVSPDRAYRGSSGQAVWSSRRIGRRL